jgi:CheY-like chemotaxis protein
MKTILVAEDDADDVFLLRRALTRAGIQAQLQIVADGEQAMSYLRGEHDYDDRQRFPFPSLTLLDIKMPRMTGLEVLRAIRDDPSLKRLPVIIFSSSHQPRDIDQAFDLHANSYLVKTGDLGFLEHLLHKVEEYWLALNQCPTCPCS